MKLNSPFFISARLAPAVKIGSAVLSFDSGNFVFDFEDGTEHNVTGFRFPQRRIRGMTDADVLQGGFSAILSFLSACAESREYAVRNGKPASEGENSDLFPEWVGEWAEQNKGEIEMIQCEIDESPGLLAE